MSKMMRMADVAVEGPVLSELRDRLGGYRIAVETEVVGTCLHPINLEKATLFLVVRLCGWDCAACLVLLGNGGRAASGEHTSL